MLNKHLSNKRKAAVWMLGQLLVLVLCALYLKYTYHDNILPDKQANQTFKQTTCFLISKRLTTKGEYDHRYRADFLISYNVNSVQYNRWVSGNGLDMSFSGSHGRQQALINQFEVGKMYPCWYSPAYPSMSLLVQRHNWVSTFPLMLSFLAFVLALYFFVKNLLKLLA